jgi:hypothetical protein
VTATPWGSFRRRRILSWRIRVPLWLASTAAGWGIGSASGTGLAGRVIGAAAGLAMACLAEVAFCYRRVPPETASPVRSPEEMAAHRAEFERRRAESGRRQLRWDAEAVPSPGGWQPSARTLPAWNWTPPEGIRPRWDRVPAWVRFWYRTPFADRYAHAWMWRHGGWDVLPPAAT